MKLLFSIFLSIALSSVPPESKTCPDCINFNNAVVDLMDITHGNIANWWVELIDEACAEGPADKKENCQLVSIIGFQNILTKMLKTQPQDWCSDITLCSALSDEEKIGVDHCDSCLEFYDDVITIAKVCICSKFHYS